MMFIERLQPASPQDVSFYLPYFQGNKRSILPIALSLYQKGVLEGKRKIEGSDSVPFIATWNVSTLPVDLTRCRLQFDGNAELSYEIVMSSSELVDFLIEVIVNFQRDRAGSRQPQASTQDTAPLRPLAEPTTDFPKSFYRKLLRLDE